MGVYRGGEGATKIGAIDALSGLLQQLEDAVADAVAAQTAAATSASNAETTYQNFINLYLGAFATDPTTDNDGSTLEGGELYYNTTSNQLLVYDLAETAWKPSHLNLDGSSTMLGDLDMGGKSIVDYTESTSSPFSTAGAITFDLDVGNIFTVTLAENITSITFSNVPTTDTANIVLVLTQDATGSRTVTWPASVKWSGGVAPTLSTTASAVDIISMFTTDAGTTWYAVTGGLGFS